MAPTQVPVPPSYLALAPSSPVVAAPQAQPILDAVQLDIPALSSPVATGWRPPLYPIPWAPGPEDHFYFNRPILADEKNWPLDDYRYGGIYEGFDNVHTGIDIDSPIGTPVFSIASGKVIWSGYGAMSGGPDPDDPYGLAVVIKHDFGFRDQRLYTLYAHLSQADVRVGDLVNAGQRIGLVGLTGATTGPHLHLEVRVGENNYFASRNPELWLVPAQGWGVLVGQIKDTAGRLIKSKEVYISQFDSDLHWTVRTYGARSINSDDYYQENMVLSDMPAGKYQIMFEYLYQRYYLDVEVFPGLVTYFSFQGRKGFSTLLPSASDSGALPPVSP